MMNKIDILKKSLELSQQVIISEGIDADADIHTEPYYEFVEIRFRQQYELFDFLHKLTTKEYYRKQCGIAEDFFKEILIKASAKDLRILIEIDGGY